MVSIRKLLSVLMIFVVMGTLAATGAFTTVEAERTADVDAAGDASALLALTPAEDPADSSFINQDNTQDSTFEIDLSDNGVNANATTNAENLFNITNNGEESVDVWINTEGGVQEENPDVNTTFYIDSSNIGQGKQIKTTNIENLQDAVRIGERVDEFDAFITSTDFDRNSDLVISESRAPDNVEQSPQDAGIAVTIESGETVTVSLAIEIESDADIDLKSDQTILNETTIFAVDDERDRIKAGTTTDTTAT